MRRTAWVFGWTGALLAGVALSSAMTNQDTEAEPSEFTRTTIDLGCVVSDVEKSVAFYRDVIGFTEVPGFSVPADFCKNAGLTDQHDLNVRVLVLGKGDDATKLKLMSVPDAKPAASDNTYIHSQLGFSYLTIFVRDLKASLKRAADAGVSVIANGPVPLDPENPAGMNLAIVRDPDGNLVELLGPMPQ